jgi:hypothetical protein
MRGSPDELAVFNQKLDRRAATPEADGEQAVCAQHNATRQLMKATRRRILAPSPCERRQPS